MTEPKRLIAQIANKAQFLEMDLASYEATMAELLELSMPSSLAGEKTSGGDHSDPVLSGLYSREMAAAKDLEYRSSLQKALDHLNRAYNVSVGLPRFSEAADHAAASNAAWCNGGGVEPWANPLCAEYAVTGTAKGSDHPFPGLCPTCDRARRRHLANPDQQHRKRGATAA